MVTHKVLLVEDDQDEADYVQSLLSRAIDAIFEVVHVSRLTDAIREVGEKNYDVILLDLGLPDSQGSQTVVRMARATDVPIVVLSGNQNDDLNVNSLESGALEFLPKNRAKSTDLLAKSLRYAVERNQLEKEIWEARRRAEEERQRAEEISARLAYLKLGSDDEPGDVTSEELASFANQYRNLVLAHIRAVQNGTKRPAVLVEKLATDLVNKKVGARDLGQLHVDVVDAFRQRMSHFAFRDFTREARLTLVDLMGHVLDAYRR